VTSIVLGRVCDLGPELSAISAIEVPADQARLRDARFDAGTDSWSLTTADGRCISARILIDTRPSTEPTIAVHGMPNYFRIPGPDTTAQSRLVAHCLELLRRSGSTRIEARARIRLRRRPLRALATKFYLTGSIPTDEHVYDGAATLTLAEGDIAVHARLSGHLDAIDGRYHWRGSIAGELPDEVLTKQRSVTVSTTGSSAPARVMERTPWGGYTVTGVGAPPFAID